MSEHADIVIIGGGIVGLASAWRISQSWPDLRIALLEKETEVASHQTGHNSGVLHSGIYYKPGTLRAKNCRTGKEAMEAFCAAEGIDYQICGKVIVAVNESELPQLNMIFDRGRQNGVRCEMISAERLHELEPHVAGIQAIHVPEAGIVNYKQVSRRLAEQVTERGGEIHLGERVTGVEETSGEVLVTCASGRQQIARYAINCGGLHSDRLAALAGEHPEAKIVPFRGEYFELKPEAQRLCNTLIYPTPDPSFPFLGVHFTRMIEGGVECGPNAVLAWAREGYRKRDINLRDLFETLCFRGFRRLAWKHWRVGLGEMHRSFSKRAFVKALQRLVPEIQASDLESVPAGVRAQALTPDGSLVDDFRIQTSGRMVHVLNAPSPAATSSLNIGSLVAHALAERMDD